MPHKNLLFDVNRSHYKLVCAKPIILVRITPMATPDRRMRNQIDMSPISHISSISPISPISPIIVLYRLSWRTKSYYLAAYLYIRIPMAFILVRLAGSNSNACNIRLL